MKILGGLLGIAFGACLTCAVLFGYGMNIYKLAKCDFEQSYKAEIIRGAGIVIAPVGIIVGYIDLGE